MLLKRPRIKDESHLNFIRSLVCCICKDNTSTEAAHLRMAGLEYGKQYTGKGTKPSDTWTLPLCGKHHRLQHQMGEEQFWFANNINPFVLALSLSAASGDLEMADAIIEGQCP